MDTSLQIHRKLGADLSNFIIDHDLKQLKTRCSQYITPREIQKMNDFIDIYEYMEKKGAIEVGKYEKLKEIVKDYDKQAFDMIVKAEKDIKAKQNENSKSYLRKKFCILGKL